MPDTRHTRSQIARRPRGGLGLAWVLWIPLLVGSGCAPGPKPDAIRSQEVFELRRQARDELLRGDATEALRALRRALVLAPGTTEIWDEIGLVHVARGAVDSAQVSFERSIRLDPTRSEPHLNLAILLMKRGVTGRARSEFEEAVQSAPSNPLVYRNFGVALLEVGKPEEAKRYLETAIELDSTHGPAYAALGQVHAGAGRSSQALAHFARAESLGVGSSSFRSNYGLELLRAGHPAESRLQLERALELDPTSRSAWNHLAAACLAEGRLGDARGHLRRAHDLEPQDQDTRFNLGSVLVRLDLYHEALELLEKPKPTRADLLALLGMTLRGLGRTGDALPHLREAARRAPRDAGIWNNLGVVLDETGDPQGALEVWQSVLRFDPGNATALANLEARGDRAPGVEDHHGSKPGP